jgi:hypothetical protein
LKEPEKTTNIMRSQLSRLFGQLRAMQAGDYTRPLFSST